MTERQESNVFLRISIANHQSDLPVSTVALRRWLRCSAAKEWRGRALSVAVVGHEEMVALNRRFTGRVGDTDVLAFAMEGPEGSSDSLVGEIVVCASRAVDEATARGVPPEWELALYVVHGALHLQGFDDHSPGDRARMYAREEEVLRAAGVPYARHCPRRRVRAPVRRGAGC